MSGIRHMLIRVPGKRAIEGVADESDLGVA